MLNRDHPMTYALAGLRITSEFPLHGVATSEDASAGPESVVVRRATVPASLGDQAQRFPDAEWDGERVLIRIPGTANYLVMRDRIDVDALEESVFPDICDYLLGPAFGALCHLRRIFMLHASAVELARGCVAFAGQSGAGKSTMAAALAARGLPVIADDVAFIRTDEHGRACVYPGSNRIRLWDSSLDGLGHSGGRFEHVDQREKFFLPTVAPRASREPCPLAAVFQLEAAPAGSPVTIARAYGSSAGDVFLTNIAWRTLAKYMNRGPDLFSDCVRLANQVEVLRLMRPKDFAALNSVVDAVVRHPWSLAIAT